MSVPKPGDVWKVWYPARNRCGTPLEYVPRRILVAGVLDYSHRFMSVDKFLRRPMVRRGPLLVCGDDLDLGLETRQLYVHATSEYDAPLARIACLDRDENVVSWLGREYEATFLDRSEMMYEIGRWLTEEHGCGLHLGINFGATP